MIILLQCLPVADKSVFEFYEVVDTGVQGEENRYPKSHLVEWEADEAERVVMQKKCGYGNHLGNCFNLSPAAGNNHQSVRGRQ